ncbi:MAG: tRNA (N(6)-L-threonylcarbamoyladenosine(37)-C(2))-methylthiotransferase MtaB, partial [Methylococcales bacterium]
MQVYLTSLGCRLNEAELQTWAHQFNRAGCSIASKAEDAQLIVMNSCAVTQEAVRKSRQSVRRLKRNNPDAKMIVSGCYASLNTQEAAGLLGVDLVVTNVDKDKLCNLGLDLLASSTSAANQAEFDQQTPVLFQLGRQRAFIKVQDGCRYRCTFCIVTIARGEEVSRPVADIIDEINRLAAQNVQEVVLTGVHLGGYGHDVQSDLPRLIQTILDETDIPRIRMGSLEPWELNETFFGLFENPRMMSHLHLPMQSGSNAVLQRMARRCKTTDFATMISKMRTQIADLNITTDMITGFPGETDAEWQQTLEFVEQMQFGSIHIFPYSPREGTRAATLPNQVNPAIRKARASQLAEISQQLKINTMQTFLNQRVAVLWETEKYSAAEDKTLIYGYTPNYIRVAMESSDSSAAQSNSINLVTLTNIARNKAFLW